MTREKKHPALPTRQQILDFIRTSSTPVGKREIARAFHVKGGDRIALKALLKELAEEGAVDRGRKRRMAASGTLPEVAVLDVIGPDPDGELLARPANWTSDEAPPRIELAPERQGAPALGAGDRVLARLERVDARSYKGRIIRQLAGSADRVVGVYAAHPEGGGWLKPTDRRVKAEYRILPAHANGAKPGDVVVLETLHTHRLGRLQGRVVERLGQFGEPRTISMISIAEHGIPVEFPPEAVAEAEAAEPVALGDRTEFRDLPLVTIDGEDARDFDDAVWAAPDPDPKNPGGWKICVAIADVAHYVAPGSALDRAARQRGNSVYFPDRVVPMLPEALSNGLCSLKPGEERPCMAVEMTLDADGNRTAYRFRRGLMRSVARLTYEQVQDAADGHPNDLTAPLLETVIRPLYGAFRSLLKARERRGTLELDIPERRILLDENGRIARIAPRTRLDSHRLIEEFMIAANVAAAEALERHRQPAMYRVHDQPDPVKLEALRESLAGFGLPLAKGQVIRPKLFTDLLLRATKTPYAQMIHELVLRTQSQAVYAPGNIGHFGLALSRYAHFTSPIRRYSDLLVHRGIINAYRFGADGLASGAEAEFETLGQHISATERRAAAAERDAVDRYCAAFLAERTGQLFQGVVTGVTRFGLFVMLNDTGASGIVPISSLPDDYYEHDARAHALVGRRWGRSYRLGESAAVRLVEAEPVTGGLVFHLVEGVDSAEPAPADRSRTAAAPFRRGQRTSSKNNKINNKPRRPKKTHRRKR